MEINALKIRGWTLETGEILVLIFIGKDPDNLVLLSEQYARDQQEFEAIAAEAQLHLRNAAREAGFADATVFAQIPGAEKA